MRFARPQHVWRGHAGQCSVCSRRTWFLVTCGPDALRNDAFCLWCGSISRQRHLALAILGAFEDRGVRSLRDLAARRDLAVWHTAASGPLARALCRAPRVAGRQNLVLTEFFDGVPLGSVNRGVLCQDLQAPTFEDARFDLVITEDVLEHVPDWRLALREVHRVLKPGGHHIFTVPYNTAGPTRALFERRDGAWVPLGPVEYHDDAIRGRIAAYTVFGVDLPGEMEGMGFAVSVRSAGTEDVKRFGTEGCTTFVAKKGR